jgi:hypothetical protein
VPEVNELADCPNPWCISNDPDFSAEYQLYRPMLVPRGDECFFVSCPRCLTRGPYCETPDEARAAWNKPPRCLRTPDDGDEQSRVLNFDKAVPSQRPDDAVVEALRECMDKLWVLRCNSRDPLDREAADLAFNMGKAALSQKDKGRERVLPRLRSLLRRHVDQGILPHHAPAFAGPGEHD